MRSGVHTEGLEPCISRSAPVVIRSDSARVRFVFGILRIYAQVAPRKSTTARRVTVDSHSSVTMQDENGKTGERNYKPHSERI